MACHHSLPLNYVKAPTIASFRSEHISLKTAFSRCMSGERTRDLLCFFCKRFFLASPYINKRSECFYLLLSAADFHVTKENKETSVSGSVPRDSKPKLPKVRLFQNASIKSIILLTLLLGSGLVANTFRSRCNSGR